MSVRRFTGPYSETLVPAEPSATPQAPGEALRRLGEALEAWAERVLAPGTAQTEALHEPQRQVADPR